jgi:hypothetical protein
MKVEDMLESEGVGFRVDKLMKEQLTVALPRRCVAACLHALPSSRDVIATDQ